MPVSEVFKNRLNEYIAFADSQLEKLLSFKKDEQHSVREAMLYSAAAKGKRVRPVLVFEFCRALSGDYKKAAEFACAVEMIHAYSLIHDDLPCMDDDDLRRGKPSCHIKFGEANALLAGDALLTMAFKTAAAANLPDSAKTKAVMLLSEYAGINGMIGGQAIDLKYENLPVSEEILQNINRLKTSALLSCACAIGAVAAGADEKQIESAKKYGEMLGLAFQIVDDILDVTANQSKLGKPVGSDAENGKTTYVSLLGLENAKKAADHYSKQAEKCLKQLDDSEFLLEFTEQMLNRGY